jgi:hypothetical protein
MLTQQSPRGRARSGALSKLVMHRELTAEATIAALVGRVPPARRDDPTSFLGNLALNSAGRGGDTARTRQLSYIPEEYWVQEAGSHHAPTASSAAHVQASKNGGGGAATTTGAVRFGALWLFPSPTPASRADTFYVADAVDRMLEDNYRDHALRVAHAAAHQQQLATSPGLSNDAAGCASPVSEATKLQNTAEILFVGLLECARVAGFLQNDLGLLTSHLTEAVRTIVANYDAAVAKLKHEVAVARSYNPAKQIEEMQNLVFSKDIRISACEREVRELKEEQERLRDQAATADTWKRARDELAAVLCRHAERNAYLMDAEEARLETERAALAAAAAQGQSNLLDDSGELPYIPSYADHAVQANLDTAFDTAMAENVERLVAVMNLQMAAVERLCMPFYPTAGLQAVSRPATIAISKLEELVKRCLEADGRSRAAVEGGSYDTIVGRAPAPMSRQLVARLLSGCEDAARQVEARIAALAERNDIRKLAYPLAPPGAPHEPCALCNRTEVDTAVLQAGQELDRARAAITQQEKAIELLQAERLVLHEELELALARLTRRRDLFADASVMTDPMRLADRSPQQETLAAPKGIVKSPGSTAKVPQPGIVKSPGSTAKVPQPGIVKSSGSTGKVPQPPATSRTNASTTHGGTSGTGRRVSSDSRASPFSEADNTPRQQTGTAATSFSARRPSAAVTPLTALDGTMDSGDAALMNLSASIPTGADRVRLTWANVCAVASEASRHNAPSPASTMRSTLSAFAAAEGSGAAVKPLMWTLRHVAGVWRAKAASDKTLRHQAKPLVDGRTALLEYARGNSSSEKAAAQLAGSILASVREHAACDGRARLIASFLEPTAIGTTVEAPSSPSTAASLLQDRDAAVFTTCSDVMVTLRGALKASRGVGGSPRGIGDNASGGDLGRLPEHIPLLPALAAVAEAVSGSDGILHTLARAMTASAFTTPEPCAAEMAAAALHRLSSHWPQRPTSLESDGARYKQLQLYQVVAAVAAVGHHARTPLVAGLDATVNGIFTGPPASTRDSWAEEAAEQDAEGVDEAGYH